LNFSNKTELIEFSNDQASGVVVAAGPVGAEFHVDVVTAQEADDGFALHGASTSAGTVTGRHGQRLFLLYHATAARSPKNTNIV